MQSHNADAPAPQKRRRIEPDSKQSTAVAIASASKTPTVHLRIINTHTSFKVSKYLIMKLRYFQILFSEKAEPFVDFNTDAIHVFLLLLHHEYSQLPSKMSVDQLYALAELCAEIDSDDTQDTSESLGDVLSAHDILSSSKHVRTWISIG
jgi:hypothetical protein